MRLVLHCGAQKRPSPLALQGTIEDPAALLTWRDPDRAVASFVSVDAIEANRDALLAVLHQWIAHTQQ